ncbi:hypothetical protein MBAV_001921, partial [Candidatus Magnetobacterium bavaricum]
VRKESRTVGHVFVTMLAYILVHEFNKRTSHIKMMPKQYLWAFLVNLTKYTYY